MRHLPHFLALLFTALALVPSGAHLAALPNKIGLSEVDYFRVQGIYAGWRLFGLLLLGALASNLWLAYALRTRPRASALALAGFLSIGASLAVFFVFVFPANQATLGWTLAPDDWATLRRQWEYGHAVNAVLTLVAFCAVALAVLDARRAD